MLFAFDSVLCLHELLQPEYFSFLNYELSYRHHAWFLKTDGPNGLKMFTRAPIRTAMEGDFDTGNVRYKARERYSFGWSDWRGIFGSPGA